MDPAALSVADAARDLGVTVDSGAQLSPLLRAALVAAEAKTVLFRKVLANEAVEQVVEGPLTLEHLTVGDAVPFPTRYRAAARAGRRGAEKAQPRRPIVAEPRRNADDPGAFPRRRPRPDRRANWRRSPKPGRNIARTRRSRADDRVPRRSRRSQLRQPAEGDDFRRDAGGPPPPRRRRLVRQRLRGQRRRRRSSTTSITSASRWRRTTIRRRSSPTAARTPASAA